MISVDDYFLPYPNLRTPEFEAAAEGLLEKVDSLREGAHADGVDFYDNPITKTEIAGEHNGGIRPPDETVGAPASKHKTAHAVDVYDPSRRFASWCLAHLDRLRDHGLHMEDPRWTFSATGHHWVHLQDVAPASGKLEFIPSRDAPLGPLPDAWQ